MISATGESAERPHAAVGSHRCLERKNSPSPGTRERIPALELRIDQALLARASRAPPAEPTRSPQGGPGKGAKASDATSLQPFICHQEQKEQQHPQPAAEQRQPLKDEPGSGGAPAGPRGHPASEAEGQPAAVHEPLEGPSGGSGSVEAAALAAQHPPEALHSALMVRYVLGLRGSASASLTQMLGTHHLADKPVRLLGAGGAVVGSGRLAAGGGVCCACEPCGGRRFKLQAFLAHCGAAGADPRDALVLEETGRTLNQQLALVNSPHLAAAADAAGVDLNSDVCRVCEEPGMLVCCELCTNAYHQGCARLAEVPETDWLCPECEEEQQHARKRAKKEPAASRPGSQAALVPASAGGAKLRFIIKRAAKQEEPGPGVKREDGAALGTPPQGEALGADAGGPEPDAAREQHASAPGRPTRNKEQQQEQQGARMQRDGLQAPAATGSAGPSPQGCLFMLVLGRLRTSRLPPHDVQAFLRRYAHMAPAERERAARLLQSRSTVGGLRCSVSKIMQV